MNLDAQAIFHTARQQVQLQTSHIAPLAADQVLIKTTYSAISPGTEGMIFSGHFPQDTVLDTHIASLSGNFCYPFRYGYALVGEIIDVGSQVAKKWQNRKVFAFHPHQNYAVVALQDCHLIPAHITLQQALFLPNMEAAVNFVMDAAPLLGEKTLVLGQGIVGLLTTALLAQFPLRQLLSADPALMRRNQSLQCGASFSVDPNNELDWQQLRASLFTEQGDGLDLVFELSGNMAALNKAIELCGFSARVIIGSWYGNDKQPVDLGGNFHRRRIRLLSSQVSSIEPQLSGRWNKTRRIQLVWDKISEIRPERFITHRFSIQQAQQALELISGDKEYTLQVIFEYHHD